MKTFIEKLNPELRNALKRMSPITETNITIEELQDKWTGISNDISTDNRRNDIRIFDQNIMSIKCPNHVKVRIYWPIIKDNEMQMPVILWAHGGGFVAGNVYMDDPFCSDLALSCNSIVVSVDYRLAPQYPYPAAINDCYQALLWCFNGDTNLPINRSRIIVGGRSAGACLVAGLTLLVRKNDDIRIFYQILLVPVLDDRHKTASSYAVLDKRVWNRELSLKCWDAYLAGFSSKENIPVFAAPARENLLEDLPDTFIAIADNDILRDEGIVYGQRLMEAGVATELHVYSGTFHDALSLYPEALVNQKLIKDLHHSITAVLNS